MNVKRSFPNIKRINFYDEVFLPDIAWAESFCERYKKEIGLPFYCMFYPGTCKEEILNILKTAGLAGVWLGVQSGSERVRKEVFKRNHSNSLIIDQANLFKKFGIGVRYDFIFDNPFESFDESLESIYLMLKLPEPFSLNLFSLKYFPNTEITKMAIDLKIITPSMLEDNLDYNQHSFFISQKEGNSSSIFVNNLVMYISLIANQGELQRKKEEIFHLIADYKGNQDIQPIRNMLYPHIENIKR